MTSRRRAARELRFRWPWPTRCNPRPFYSCPVHRSWDSWSRCWRLPPAWLISRRTWPPGCRESCVRRAVALRSETIFFFLDALIIRTGSRSDGFSSPSSSDEGGVSCCSPSLSLSSDGAASASSFSSPSSCESPWSFTTGRSGMRPCSVSCGPVLISQKAAGIVTPAETRSLRYFH